MPFFWWVFDLHSSVCHRSIVFDTSKDFQPINGETQSSVLGLSGGHYNRCERLCALNQEHSEVRTEQTREREITIITDTPGRHTWRTGDGGAIIQTVWATFTSMFRRLKNIGVKDKNSTLLIINVSVKPCGTGVLVSWSVGRPWFGISNKLVF